MALEKCCTRGLIESKSPLGDRMIIIRNDCHQSRLRAENVF